LYEVRDASNAALIEPTDCDSPCESWFLGNPIGGCTAICRSPEVTKLAPGEGIETQWSGRYVRRAELPRECNTAMPEENPVTCDLTKRVEPGSFTFSARAGSEYACNDYPGDCSDCEPNASGGCILRGAMVTGNANDARAAVDLDGSYGVSGSAGSANRSAGQVRSVELVFRRRL
jgi:hypothetical protein